MIPVEQGDILLNTYHPYDNCQGQSWGWEVGQNNRSHIVLQYFEYVTLATLYANIPNK